jgi:surface protein
MDAMFLNAHNFQGIGLSNWNTAKVTAMNNQFFGASSFVGNITTWDTSNVGDMSSMVRRQQ